MSKQPLSTQVHPRSHREQEASATQRAERRALREQTASLRTERARLQGELAALRTRLRQVFVGRLERSLEAQGEGCKKWGKKADAKKGWSSQLQCLHLTWQWRQVQSQPQSFKHLVET